VQLDKDMNQSGHSWSLDNIPHSQLKPLEKLQSLKLYGLIGKLPEWIKQLGHLRKLNLHMNMLQQEDIDVLGDLTSLNVLRLCLTEFQDGQLQFVAGFGGVFTLEISCNSRLQAVKFDEDVMTDLVALKIRCCTSMSSLQLSGLEKLKFLKEVWVSGSYDYALVQHLQRQLNAIGQSSQAPRLVVEERSSS
jgi:DNA-binding protein YbaB